MTTDPRQLSRAGIEVWKPLPALEHRYHVSNLGRIKRLPVYGGFDKRGRERIRPERILKQTPDTRQGYLQVTIDKKTRPVHRLVLLTFDGPLPKGLLSRHLDSDNQNNALHNLRYGTYSDNAKDRVIAGNNNLSVLTAKDIAEIRAAPMRYGIRAALAKKYGVSPGWISQLRSKRR